MDREVRVRIAPSPTGEPHVGTAYIALFNMCYARSKGGKFILRIEDTDRERSTEASERSILDSLKWLGLTWDEGPGCEGDYGPYRQSERGEIYRKHGDMLLESGHAYRCFCTKEDLDALRARQMAEKRSAIGYFAADSPCRKLSPEEINRRLENRMPHVIRLRVPDQNPDEEVSFYDNIRKKTISLKMAEVDDQILLKTDGFPTYHLANVVDDHLMKISVVMRGEEWISSTFKHVLLYRALGWEMPDFYHLSLLRNTDKNKSKISKRKNPVSLLWFRAAGYAPQALLNFLALMGYSRDTEGKSEEEIRGIEIFSLDELTAEFDPSRISVSGPAFDYEKLNALNEIYLQKMSEPQFESYLRARITYLMSYLGDLLPHVQKRFKRLQREMGFWTDFLFKLALDYQKEDFARLGLPLKDIAAMLGQVKKVLKSSPEKLKTLDDFQQTIGMSIRESGLESKTIHMALRLAVMGSSESLPLYEAMSALGVYRCINRLDEAAAFLSARST
jgi:glutamyl-tRNA synthetase